MKLIQLLRKSFVVLMLSFMAIGMMSACSSSEESSDTSSNDPNCDQAFTEEEKKACFDALDDGN